MAERIGDKIEAKAFFKSGKISPLSFIWQNWEYKVERVNFSWIKREGYIIYHYFSVNVAGNIYELCFKKDDLSWYLSKIHLGT